MLGTGEMLGIKEALPCLAREIRDMSQNSPSQFGGTETLGKQGGRQTDWPPDEAGCRKTHQLFACRAQAVRHVVFHDSAAVVGDPGRLVRA